ncbi:Glutamine-fructose-6-phosphate transaminase (isomerizing) [Roseobacter sp. SK209-2-6]|uniref:SIS domain-containing protein n=1 Tax=Roseobacter sp. SK209-2-6 TaxID=388739 RepID=UPI0000F3EC8B|nr:SIS domain-containing protein [Roseobacter sp. SK209-2-6]EBA16846.1 Glutamine-fructose-6-phosphate transaminase (isomerizing) [Roseobacter sp. SK209-2-6]
MLIAATQMRREIEEIPLAVERLLSSGQMTIEDAASAIRQQEPQLLLSAARGSSDHACSYLKYVSEILLGLPMASVGPSVASIYNSRLMQMNALAISVSQSGQSPDILHLTQSFRRAGSFTVAITNDASSPLARAAHRTLDIDAGPELSVAATKTFVTSLVAGLWLLAELKQDQQVLAALRHLPSQLEAATRCDWSEAVDALTGGSLFTLGRGPTFAISNEAALKFKETCQIHAESYSSAEVLHGPVSIVDQHFPIIAFAAADAAEQTICEVADQLAQKGAQVFTTSSHVTSAKTLPHQRTGHWLTDPIAIIVSFYAMVEQVAVQAGVNPDAPRHLKKVTETL